LKVFGSLSVKKYPLLHVLHDGKVELAESKHESQLGIRISQVTQAFMSIDPVVADE
jgi:hypothetical protein